MLNVALKIALKDLDVQSVYANVLNFQINPFGSKFTQKGNLFPHSAISHHHLDLKCVNCLAVISINGHQHQSHSVAAQH